MYKIYFKTTYILKILIKCKAHTYTTIFFIKTTTTTNNNDDDDDDDDDDDNNNNNNHNHNNNTRVGMCPFQFKEAFSDRFDAAC